MIRRGSLVDEPPADAADQCHYGAPRTIDKYMGDAVMAFWNAPIENQFHEKDACHAALDMLDGVSELNKARQRESSESGLRSCRSGLE